MTTVLIGGCASTQAHLVNTGLGPFYDGVLHLVLSPDEMLGVAGMALLAGLGGAQFGRIALFTLPLAWLAGSMLGMTGRINLVFPAATGLALLIIGMLVAWDRALPPSMKPVIPAVFGLFMGLMNGAAATAGSLRMSGLIGVAATVFVLVALLAAFTVWLAGRPPWTRIVVRVAGSWIAAIGLLLTGWALR
ncbi:MAG: HupE/UreJ family protein [Verrucomicrobiales bacterium]|nr:HupE/UreJ family protein [Verrucomicrobiales bacterium]